MKSALLILSLFVFVGCTIDNENPPSGSGIVQPPAGNGLPDIQTEPGQRRYLTEQYNIDNRINIDIYYPSDYDSNFDYPILYFNDGDSFASTFLKLTQNTAQLQEPFIMVGLYAGGNRLNWYTPYNDPWIQQNWGNYLPQSEQYTQLLINNVMPFVEGRFSVDAERRAIFGISLGGLHATWAAINYPEVFSFSAGLSPSYWVDDYAVLFEDLSKVQTDNSFYFDMGTKEWNYYIPLINNLKIQGLTFAEQIFYYEILDGTHSTFSWDKRIDIPFRLFMNGGPNSEISKFQIINECIPSQSTAGRIFQRLNPLVTYENGIKLSMTTEAEYAVIEGLGEVTPDGRYLVEGEGPMKVMVSYQEWSEEVTLFNCQ
ncbi:MAG: alpha/beta hydrolase-fold protein [Cyclobacteriaceae bacterium]